MIFDSGAVGRQPGIRMKMGKGMRRVMCKDRLRGMCKAG